MWYGELKRFVKSHGLQKKHDLRQCTLIVDGNAYFHGTYRNESRCEYVLGGECDRYAAYLKKKLSCFKKSGITCYFIFNGSAKTELDRREFVHQLVIDRANAFQKGDENVYCEPIFLSDVRKQVLKELGIKYFVSEFGSIETMISLSQVLNCPVVTYNIQLCFYGVTVIEKWLTFDKETNSISCLLNKSSDIKKLFNESMVAVALTVLNEESKCFDKIIKTLFNGPGDLVAMVRQWLNNKSLEMATQIILSVLNDCEKDAFLNFYNEQTKLIGLGINKENSTKEDVLTKYDKDWFEKAVWDGKIPGVYVNLVKNLTLSGSWLIFDESKEDAILTIIDIFLCAYAMLTSDQMFKVTFIGRNVEQVCLSKIGRDFEIPSDCFFLNINNEKEIPKNIESFKKLVNKIMQGFDFGLLQSVPDDCWILIVALVYFYMKTRVDLLYAYSVVLSYVMLGPITNQVGLIEHHNLNYKHDVLVKDESKELKYEDCLSAAQVFVHNFYIKNITSIFCRKTLHNLAVFQHCLQHINYLNKMCGEGIPCTIYGKCYNATFVYNTLINLKDFTEPVDYFDSCLNESQSVLLFYKRIINVFQNSLVSVQNF